jgi:hypothetical protein
MSLGPRAVVLTAVLIAAGCAARPRYSAVPAGPDARAPATRASAELWRQFAAKLPAGTTLSLRTRGGERLTAILIGVDETGIVVSPKTRVPEPVRHIGFDEVAGIDLLRNGGSLVKAAAIGAGVGAGVFLGLLFLLLQAYD